METIKDKIIAKQDEYIAYLTKAIKSESIIEAITAGVRSSYESELSRLKDEGKDSNVLNPDVKGQNLPNDYVKTDYTKTAEQSDKSIISATNDNPFGAVKELAEQTKNDVEVDSDVKIYNERQDLQAQFRKPAEQSDKLTAEEILVKNNVITIYSDIHYAMQVGASIQSIITSMKEYASQFVGEKVTDEILKEELVKFAEFKDAMKRIHDLTNNEMVVNNYLKKRQPIVEQKHSGTD